ncbi:unnamed protein product [Absidia cylindrospora]
MHSFLSICVFVRPKRKRKKQVLHHHNITSMYLYFFFTFKTNIDFIQEEMVVSTASTTTCKGNDKLLKSCHHTMDWNLSTSGTGAQVKVSQAEQSIPYLISVPTVSFEHSSTFAQVLTIFLFCTKESSIGRFNYHMQRQRQAVEILPPHNGLEFVDPRNRRPSQSQPSRTVHSIPYQWSNGKFWTFVDLRPSSDFLNNVPMKKKKTFLPDEPPLNSWSPTF